MLENQPAQSPAPAENQQQPATPSLEEIAQQFNVEEQATQFQAKPEVPQNPFQFAVPDPLIDQDGYRKFATSQVENWQRTDSALKQLTEKLESYERQQREAQVSADISKAVEKVNTKVGGDPLMVEIALEREYRVNAAFKRIWDNRHQNPRAFETALEAVSHKIAPIFAMRQDPKLAENQRAMQSSQRSMATTQKTDELHEALSMSPGKFEEWWEQKKRGLI